MTQEQLNATRTFTQEQMLEWRAIVIDRCIAVVRISAWQPDEDSYSQWVLAMGAAHQLKASIAALELYKAGPQTTTAEEKAS